MNGTFKALVLHAAKRRVDTCSHPLSASKQSLSSFYILCKGHLDSGEITREEYDLIIEVAGGRVKFHHLKNEEVYPD